MIDEQQTRIIVREEFMCFFPFNLQKDRLKELISERVKKLGKDISCYDLEDEDKLFESYMLFIDEETDIFCKKLFELREDNND